MPPPVMRLEVELSGGENYVALDAYADTIKINVDESQRLYRKVREFTAIITRPGAKPEVAIGKGATPSEAMRKALKQVYYFDEPLSVASS